MRDHSEKKAGLIWNGEQIFQLQKM